MSKSKKRKTFDNEFKNNVGQYVNAHAELSRAQAAADLGIGQSTLSTDGSRKPENLMTARSTRLEAEIINQMKPGKSLV